MVEKDGQTVGYFVPVHKTPSKADFEALKSAALKLDALLTEQGISEDELVQDFKEMRKEDKHLKTFKPQ